MEPQSPTIGAITWHSPSRQKDRDALARWRSAVGSPLIRPAETVVKVADALTVVSWNVAIDAGDVAGYVKEIQASAPARPIALLLQEVFRSGDDIPERAVGSEYADALGGSRADREIDDVARGLGMWLYYVPSMRNGAPGRRNEDRGNAILSSIPLYDFVAIELPFQRQRRVAVGATVRGMTRDGREWALRLASAHLDNMAGTRHVWIGGEFARARQARGLRQALASQTPTVLAGDFNTWFGFSDQAYVETLREYPDTRVADGRSTFRGLLRLDHVFYRLARGWRADVRRGASSAGSDHHPLITTIQF